MKPFIAAVIIAAGLAAGAAGALDSIQTPVDRAFATSSVRLEAGE
jgi:hypothetical protein